jgi:hypothetical protein
MTVGYAAQVYLAMATRYNALSGAAYKKLPNGPSLAEWRAYFKLAAAYRRDFADRLRGRIWPKVAAADITLLLRKDAQVAMYELRLAKTTDVAEFNRTYAAYRRLDFDASGLANAVRTNLGLPAVPIS